MKYQLFKSQFEIKQTYTSLGVAYLGINVLQYFRRHQCGDWGDVSKKQKQANELALVSGGSLLSQFNILSPDGKTNPSYVFTEEDRGRTVVLLKSESWF
jgi:hypothetical protein